MAQQHTCKNCGVSFSNYRRNSIYCSCKCNIIGSGLRRRLVDGHEKLITRAGITEWYVKVKGRKYRVRKARLIIESLLNRPLTWAERERGIVFIDGNALNCSPNNLHLLPIGRNQLCCDCGIAVSRSVVRLVVRSPGRLPRCRPCSDKARSKYNGDYATIDMDQVIEDYSKGKGAQTIAKSIGVSHGCIRHRLKKLGVPLRTRKSQQALYRIMLDKDELIRLHLGERKCMYAISKQLKVNVSVVRRCLVEYGIPIQYPIPCSGQRGRPKKS